MKPLHAVLLAGLAVCLADPLVPTAQAQEQPWEPSLRQQLLSEKDCELNYLTDIRSFELLGRQTVKARAHCMDKRAYDVTRQGEEDTFKLEACEVVTC